MKEVRHLRRYAQLFAMWCLIVTIFVDTAIAYEQYDSSIQRSNFLTIDPTYKKLLDEQIKERRAGFTWNMRFDAQSLQTDQNNQSQSVGATIGTQLNYKVIDRVSFKAKANLGLESGRSQDIFGDLEPNSGVYPRELKLSVIAIEDHLDLEAGQISQTWINEPLFIGGLGFPGASEKLKFENKRVKVNLRAQQLIPTSSTLSTRVQGKEATPSLMTETGEITWNISSNNFVLGRFTWFNYNDLPSNVAYWSRIYGNSPSNFGNDVNNSQFRYDFSGWIGQLAFEQKISNSLTAQIKHSVIKNEKAPSEVGEAQNTSLIIANDFGRWIVAGEYNNYFVESDAVPAFYNSYKMGHNNRIGNGFKLSVESKSWGIIFSGEYYKADLLRDQGPIASGLQQNNQETFYFKMETMYDFI